MLESTTRTSFLKSTDISKLEIPNYDLGSCQCLSCISKIFNPMNCKAVEKLIETVTEEELEEVAVSQDEIHGKQLAILHQDYDEGDKILVLYNPSYVAQLLKKQPDTEDWYDDDFEQVVIGAIRLSKNKECGDDIWTVSFSVAEKGYGPFMYDAAFSVISPQFLASDRTQTSPKARNVWKVISTTRKGQFRRKELPEECWFEDWDEIGKEEVLNYAYAIKNPINLSNLETAHGKLYMSIPLSSRNKVMQKIRTYGIKLFQKKYGGLG